MDTLKPIEILPDHLNAYVVQQDYDLYTPRDHAGWRFIMKVSGRYFENHAHSAYKTGLKETGISTDRIPHIAEMDSLLRKFGWRAVAVSGFIPPAVFMELQSLGVLPIACDMRQFEHLSYTPAPDIVHEAAGHAPILADADYRKFVRRFGEIARHAIATSDDMEMYEAIRHLSVVKEDPDASKQDIQDAQARLESAKNAIEYISENALLSRLYWWTVEYGLVGSLHADGEPRIYGAGLLSSVGESQSCLAETTRKIPLTADSLNTSYDITRPQPQLFVTPTFDHVLQVLESYADTMAFRRGGAEGLTKAKQARSVVTVHLDTGAAVSGCLADFRVFGPKGQPEFIKFSGPCQITYEGVELPGQGIQTHRDGFSCPIGRVKSGGMFGALSELSQKQLDSLGSAKGQTGKIEFESGTVLEGKLTEEIRRDGKLILLRFEPARVTSATGETLFDPSWGSFDLLCGTSVTSVSGGAGDRSKYARDTNTLPQLTLRPKTNLSESNRDVQPVYQSLRDLRSRCPRSAEITPEHWDRIESLLPQLTRFPEDWLARFEVLEFCRTRRPAAPLASRVSEIAHKIETELNENYVAPRDGYREHYSLSVVIQSGLNSLRAEVLS